ncbi:hypothetical protein JMJ56_03465 [Belnapia sp. T18]|uniref:Uncharacterized protein n=1 Tax=Belnapia arida TaxID=2804533 RepID=A0ABS1TYW3_9PROT|nr:hypothetical protein [Belnapia arida]MBL6077050.1 hypothetical protein [Belnapia arida]
MRRVLLTLLLLTGPALAEEATVLSPGPEVRLPERAAPARPQPRRPALRKPPPLNLAKHAALPLPPRQPQPGNLAPVPNRMVERQAPLPDPRTTLGPSLLYRNLPGRGLAEEGSPSLLEDKLYRPAPGARLRVPFAY